MTSLEEYIRYAMGVRGMGMVELAKKLGVARSTLWRLLRRNPLRRGQGRRIHQLAEALADSKSKLLWMAGYNPFIDEGLNREELQVLWQLVVKIVMLLKSGRYAGADSISLQLRDIEALAAMRRMNNDESTGN